jgi:hypothetical protein
MLLIVVVVVVWHANTRKKGDRPVLLEYIKEKQLKGQIDWILK